MKVAFAGLWYLTLFLSNRFGIVPPSPSTGSANGRARDDTALMRNEEAGEPLMETSALQTAECHSEDKRDNAAARPAFLLCLPYIPLGLAVFIAGTRYFDFRNHGFDVLAGSGIGTVTAWFGFSLYHPPLSSGRRGAWGPRGREGAFGVGGV